MAARGARAAAGEAAEDWVLGPRHAFTLETLLTRPSNVRGLEQEPGAPLRLIDPVF